MKWYKFRPKYNSGITEEWDYRPFNGLELEDFKIELEYEYMGKNPLDDGYRGHEVFTIDSPPIDWLDKEIQNFERFIISYTNQKKIFEKFRKDLQNQEK